MSAAAWGKSQLFLRSFFGGVCIRLPFRILFLFFFDTLYISNSRVLNPGFFYFLSHDHYIYTFITQNIYLGWPKSKGPKNAFFGGRGKAPKSSLPGHSKKWIFRRSFSGLFLFLGHPRIYTFSKLYTNDMSHDPLPRGSKTYTGENSHRAAHMNGVMNSGWPPHSRGVWNI